LLTACWSSKGGSGTTVVAASLGLLLARREPAGAVLADLAGDLPAALGLAVDGSPGLAGWLAAGPSVPADALDRLEVPTSSPGLGLLTRGVGHLDASRAGVLATLFEEAGRPVVADCGVITLEGTAPERVALAAARSLLVTRPCYLALRRLIDVTHRPTGVVLLREPGRTLTRPDVERLAGAPVLAELDLDPRVARAVDAGLLGSRHLPRTLSRPLRHAT
jgi:hypothetical protein